MKMHDVLARRPHVLSKLVVQDRLYLAFAQKSNVIPVEVMSDKANGGLLFRFDCPENGDVSASHGIDRIDFLVCGDDIENPLFSERVEAMTTAGIDQRGAPRGSESESGRRRAGDFSRGDAGTRGAGVRRRDRSVRREVLRSARAAAGCGGAAVSASDLGDHLRDRRDG